jgi:pimeloyl-ACP methyl ester carboxylesterase
VNVWCWDGSQAGFRYGASELVVFGGSDFVKAKQWLAALGGATLAGGLAWQYLKRPRDVRWIDYVGELPHPDASRFTVVDGVRLHYQEFGAPDAPVLLLLHGYCSSNYTWKDVVEPLAAAGYRVIAPDLKGFGFSEKPADRRYHVQDHAQLVIGLLDRLGIETATFVGNSFGGAVALACALMWASRVTGLVLIDAAYNDAPLRQYPFSLYARIARTWLVGEAAVPLLMATRQTSETLLRGFFHDQQVVTPERITAYFRALRTVEGQRAALTTARQWDLNWIEQELSGITVPVLIIWGEYDRSIPVTLGVRLRARLPQAEFVVIPDCGHIPEEERPEETTALILDFCRRQAVRPVPSLAASATAALAAGASSTGAPVNLAVAVQPDTSASADTTPPHTTSPQAAEKSPAE